MTINRVDPRALRTAYILGRAFAEELNTMPHEAQNWHALERADALPPEDYKTLAREFGEVTDAMAAQYRDGFNAEFDVSLSQKPGR